MEWENIYKNFAEYYIDEIKNNYGEKVDELLEFFDLLHINSLNHKPIFIENTIFLQNNRWKYTHTKIKDIVYLSNMLKNDSKLKIEYADFDGLGIEYIAIK